MELLLLMENFTEQLKVTRKGIEMQKKLESMRKLNLVFGHIMEFSI